MARIAALLQAGVLDGDWAQVAPTSARVENVNAAGRWQVRVPPGSVEPRYRHPRGWRLPGQPTTRSRRWQAPHVGTGGRLDPWSDAVIRSVQNVGTTAMHVLRHRTEARSGRLEPRSRRMEPAPTLPTPAAPDRRQADFIGDFSLRIVGTAVALRDAVTDRWAVGNQNELIRFTRKRDTPWRKR